MQTNLQLRQILAAALLLVPFVYGQSATPEAQADRPVAAVTLDGTTLFRVRGVEAFPAEQRAREISSRIEAIAADRSVLSAALQIAEVENFTTISAGNRILMAVTEADAALEGVDRRSLTPVYRARIAEAITHYRHSRTYGSLLNAALYAAGATAVLALAFFIVHRLFGRLLIAVERSFRSALQSYKNRHLPTLESDNVWGIASRLLRFLRTGTLLLLVFLYVEFVLSLFPWTRGTASRLLSIVLDPLRTMGNAFIDSLPSLLFLAILVFVVRYVLILVRLLFEAIENGTISFPDFEGEWAKPTYTLVRVLIVAFAAIIAYPYLPGSGSDAFKGVSLFLGLVFSISSSSALANIIAGYTLTYRRAYKVGDRVKIGEAFGDVMEFRLQATYVRSLKNEEIVIPNSEILKSFVINYSALAKRHGLILHTEVGIGYETPWRQVEAMLLEAAQRTSGLLREPAPFMRQKTLGDFAITYEINAYCDQPQAASALYTSLHRNILDIFNEYGIQIMTPSYVSDPVEPKIVPRDQQFGHVPTPLLPDAR